MAKTVNTNYTSLASPASTFNNRISADTDQFNRNDVDALGNALDLHDHTSGKGLAITQIGTMTADILFTDATYDIGKSGATRPRDGFFSRNFTVGGTLNVTGAVTFTSLNLTTSLTVTSGNAAALAVGLNGATNPSFSVDNSTALQVAGFKFTGAIHNGTVAGVVTDSSGNTNLIINALGSGTIGIGTVSTGVITLGASTTISSGKTFTLTGTTVAGQPTWSSSQTIPGLTIGANTLALASSTVSGAPTWSSSQAITLSTAAQASVTSLGTLTALAIAGNLTFSGGTRSIWTSDANELDIGANATAILKLTSGGGVQVGSPTGGDKGAGTLNATNLYVAGTAVSTTSAYTQLADTILGSDTSNITFSSISGAYNHLKIVFQGRSDQATAKQNVTLQLNGITTGTYDYEYSISTNSTISGGESTAQASFLVAQIPGTTAGQAGTAGIATIELHNYVNTTFNKSFISNSGVGGSTAADGNLLTASGSNRATTAISSIKIFPSTGNFKTGTRATLYGLL